MLKVNFPQQGLIKLFWYRVLYPFNWEPFIDKWLIFWKTVFDKYESPQLQVNKKNQSSIHNY